MSRSRGSQDRPRRKRRPGTQPLKDAHPASAGGEVITRKMTPEQMRTYRRTGIMPAPEDVPLVDVTEASAARRNQRHAGFNPYTGPTPLARPARLTTDDGAN